MNIINACFFLALLLSIHLWLAVDANIINGHEELVGCQSRHCNWWILHLAVQSKALVVTKCTVFFKSGIRC